MRPGTGTDRNGRKLEADDRRCREVVPGADQGGLPAGDLGERLNQMQAWLDESCGADGWAITPSGLRGVVNDAVAIYFLDPTSAAGFVARWCIGSKVEPKEPFASARIRPRRGRHWPNTK